MRPALKVLVVDDDPAGQTLAAEICRELPSVELFSASGADALREILEGGVDAVVAEDRLSWADGRSILRAVKARRPDCPVILFTALADAEAAVEAMKDGFDDVVPRRGNGAGRLAKALRSALDRCAERYEARPPESEYRRFFEGVPVGLYRSTPEGRILEVNPALVEMMGYPDKASLLAVNVADLYAEPEQRFRWRALVEREGVARRFPIRVRRRDGVVIQVENTARAVRDGRGRIQYFEGALEDVSVREQAVAALRASEAKYRVLVEQIPAATYVASPDAVASTLYISPQIEDMLGFPRGAWTAAPELWSRRLHPEDRERVLSEIAKALESGAPFRSEYRMIDRAGRSVWIRDEAKLVRDEAARALFFQGVMFDVTESRQAAEALREKEARLRLLVEQLPLLIWTTDSGMRFTSSMGAGLAALNQQPGQVVGMTVGEYFKTDDPDARAISMTRRALAGESVTFADEWLGQAFQAFIDPLRGPDGAITGTLGVALIVTEAKRARETEGRLTAILEATPDFVGIAGRDRRPVYINRAGRAMIGIGEDEDVSKIAISDLQPGWLILEEAIPAAIARGVWSGEAIFRSRDGRIIPVSQVILAHKGADGELEFLSTIARDITERKRAEEMFRRQAEFSERLIDSSVDGIIAFDRECRFTIWNPAMARVMGLGEAQTLGRSAFEVLPFLTQTGDDRFFLEALEGKAVVARDRAYLLAGGRRGFFEGHYSPLLDESGAVVGGLAIIRDVTERRSLEEQLRQSQKMEAVGRLAGGVAHDFNNLLTVISGCAELVLLSTERSDIRHQYAEEVLRASDKAAALTQQLMAFSRQQVLQPKALDLRGVVADMDKLLRRLAGGGIELVVVPSQEPGYVLADPSQLEQVVLNLVVNARDAMPEGGRLVVETANVELDEDYARRRVDVRPGPHVMLAVSDTGLGMDAATLERVFEPFFTTKQRGTGLGLATVYGIVTQSGGHIAVESEPGRGSTFRIYLPRVAAPEPARAEEGGLRGGCETLLLVEDEDRVRDRVRLILTSHGYTVLAARSVEEAQRLGEGHEAPIHMLLTDVVLPGMNGPELAARLCVRRPGLKIVYMSGHTTETIRRHGLLDEGAALLTKPFTSDALARKVREVLDAAVRS